LDLIVCEMADQAVVFSPSIRTKGAAEEREIREEGIASDFLV